MSAARAKAALVTAPARGGIAVIVLAGPGTMEILSRVFQPRAISDCGLRTSDCTARPLGGEDVVQSEIRKPKSEIRLRLGRIMRGNEVIDEAIVTCPGPDLAEINIHGGPHVARRVLALLEEHGAEVSANGDTADTALLRVAWRAAPLAFADRHEAPASHDGLAHELLTALAEAATPMAVTALAAQWSGGLMELVWTVLAQTTSTGETPAGRMGETPMPRTTGVLASATYVACQLCDAAHGYELMRRLLTPAEVVVAGPQNAGKSTLVNALVGREVAIVSAVPGTTRDWVRHLADMHGVPVWLTDTAGLWEQAERALANVPALASASTDEALANDSGKSRLAQAVDAEAVRRAWERIKSADLVICLTATDAAGAGNGLLARLRGRPNVLHVRGKCDLAGEHGQVNLASQGAAGTGDSVAMPLLSVSGKTLAGLDRLRAAIAERLGFAAFEPLVARAFTERQARLLRAAADALEAGQPDVARRALTELMCGTAATEMSAQRTDGERTS